MSSFMDSIPTSVYDTSEALQIGRGLLYDASEDPSRSGGCANTAFSGYILTDITRGMGASKPPEEGTKAAIYCGSERELSKPHIVVDEERKKKNRDY